MQKVSSFLSHISYASCTNLLWHLLTVLAEYISLIRVQFFFTLFFFLIKIEFPETDLEFINPEPEERRDDLAEPTEECMKHIARLSQAHSLLL